jgi:hypothetical protein
MQMTEPKKAVNPLEHVTANDLRLLPRWAVVAFAARCARRVQPGFNFFWTDAPEEYVKGVESAIAQAEQAAAGKHFPAQEPTATNVAWTAVNAADAAQKAPAVLAARVAAAAADAALAATVAAGRIPLAPAHTLLPDAAYEAARAAAAGLVPSVAGGNVLVNSAGEQLISSSGAELVSAGSRGDAAETGAGVSEDFQRLREASLQESWTDDTPVPPEFFGPMWPEEMRPSWALQDEPNGDEELILELELTDNVSDQEALQIAEEAGVLADKLDRAYGGHGLKVKPIEITDVVPALVEVPQ